jgi:hypothetical protein
MADIRTLKIWALYDPWNCVIVKMHRKKRFLKPRAGHVILQLKGIYARPKSPKC